MTARRPGSRGHDLAGTGYLVQPEGSAGPGVLVLHSWWGLTPFFKDLCHRLADEGFTALAPDLLAGQLPDTRDEAQRVLLEADMNLSAALVLSSARALRSATDDPRGAIGVLGFSMGASWGLWLAARSPKEVAAAVAFYGTQSVDFAEAEAAFLGHFGADDDSVPVDDIVELESQLALVGREVTFHTYPRARHWFFESDRADAYDEAAAELAWERSLRFLSERLSSRGDAAAP